MRGPGKESMRAKDVTADSIRPDAGAEGESARAFGHPGHPDEAASSADSWNVRNETENCKSNRLATLRRSVTGKTPLRSVAKRKFHLFGYGFCQNTSPEMFIGGLVSTVQSPFTVHWQARRISSSWPIDSKAWIVFRLIFSTRPFLLR